MRKVNALPVSLLLAVCAIAPLISPTASAETIPPPENLTAVQYLRSLAPQTSGPGLVVGAPVPVHCDESIADFGAACSTWLRIYVGGQGAFGQTAPGAELYSAISQVLHQPDQRYKAADAQAVAQATGANGGRAELKISAVLNSAG